MKNSTSPKNDGIGSIGWNEPSTPGTSSAPMVAIAGTPTSAQTYQRTDAPDREALEEVDQAGLALRGAGHDHRCEHRSEEGRGSERAGVGEDSPGIGRQVVDEEHHPRTGQRQHETACQRIPAEDIALPLRDRRAGTDDGGHSSCVVLLRARMT